MNQNYSIKHWYGTLSLAPFILLFMGESYFSFSIESIKDFLGLYIVFFIFSLAISFPVFIIHNVALSIFISKQTNSIVTKVILISLTVVGIMGILLVLGGSSMTRIIMSYS